MKEQNKISITRSKKRVRDKEEKIKLIYRTFFDLIQQKGYSNVSTNHIAEAANISVGTIYRYFPQGKVTIIKSYFDTQQNVIFNLEDMAQANNGNFLDFLKKSVAQFVQTHRENLLYDRAYEQAMLENREVLEGYTQKVLNFIEKMALSMHQSNLIFNQMPLEILKKNMLRIFNIFEALTRQHLIIMPLFPTDGELVDFLMKLMTFLSSSN